jgi:23S rRNA (adenine1618-N6)-methyltransferase
LIGFKKFDWRFTGTDIDESALEYARKNVKANHLEDQIKLKLSSGNIFEQLEDENYAFCVCNPPFYEDESQAGLNKSRKLEATSSELAYPGGEEAFVEKIFKESLEIPLKFRWFTSMLGKKSSIKSLQRLLFSQAVKNNH